MSVRALTWSFNLYLQDVTAKAILHALADHADEQGRCWPSVARMALYAGCEEKTARRALVRLTELGLITREARTGRSDMFTLNIGAGKSIADHSQNREVPKTTPPIESRTPDFEAQGVDFKAHNPSQNREPNLLEPSVTKNVTVKRAARSNDEQRIKLPPDWRSSADGRAHAGGKGLDPDSTDAAFVDHFVEGKGRNEKRTLAGWDRRHRIWCDTEAKWAAARSGAGVRPAHRGSESGAFAQAAALLAGGERVRG